MAIGNNIDIFSSPYEVWEKVASVQSSHLGGVLKWRPFEETIERIKILQWRPFEETIERIQILQWRPFAETIE